MSALTPLDYPAPELTRERCMELLGWRSYANFTDEQLRAAVRNMETRRRAMESETKECA